MFLGKSGGLLVFVNEKIPSRELKKIKLPMRLQAIPIELNLERKCKWLLLPIYRPPLQNENHFVSQRQHMIDGYIKMIPNLLIFGDVNLDPSNAKLSSLIENNGLYSMIKAPTCFKSREGRCIDLMLTNMKHHFFATHTFETDFIDFHHMIYTILKTQYVKLSPQKVKYRDYRNFKEESFRSCLIQKLSANRPCDLEHLRISLMPPYLSILHINQFLTKPLRREIMKRTRLKNKANRTNSEEDLQKYRKQRNLVVKLNKRAERAYYNDLDPLRVGKGDTFWKTFKPLFSDKEANRKIILVENGEVLSDDKRISECFNEYFH